MKRSLCSPIGQDVDVKRQIRVLNVLERYFCIWCQRMFSFLAGDADAASMMERN